MAKIIAEEHKDFQLLPADSILFLKVVDCEVREIQRSNGSSWQKLEFTFNINGIQRLGDGSTPDEYGEIVGTKIWGSAPFRLTDSAENKLKRWVEAILGLEITAGFELDTDYLKGRDCRGTTSVYDKKTINPTTGRNYQGHQVEDLLPKDSSNNVIGNSWGGGQAQTQPATVPAQQSAPQDPWANTGSWEDPPF